MQDNTIQNRTNPFFVPYNTPHDTVPFERIRLEDYEPAFMEGIRRDDEATDKIVNDPAEPTFENTIAIAVFSPYTCHSQIAKVEFGLFGKFVCHPLIFYVVP
jgi:hypothetical protein